MKKYRSISFSLILLLIFAVVPFSAVAATTAYTVKFTDGLKLINPLTGLPPTDIFTGTPVEAITVEEGCGFTFPENTIIFRDYIFNGWKYTYTDDDGKSKTVIYQPGDRFENVTENLEFGASWKRPVPIDIVITGFLRFVSTESYVDGSVPDTVSVVFGSEITLPEAEMSKDGYSFLGWVDSDNNIYENGGAYTVNKLNPVLTAVWEPDGSAVMTHKVVYAAGTDDFTGTLPKTFEMYKKDTFTAAECTVENDGYRFLCWVDENGNEYIPSCEYKAEGDVLTLTAKWEKIINYYDINVSANYGGTVEYPDFPVPELSDFTLDIRPIAGYYIASVVINGNEVCEAPKKTGEAFAFDVVGIDGNLDAVITFAELTMPSVSITVSGNGAVTPIEPITDTYRFTVAPDDGNFLKEITVIGASYNVSDEQIYTLCDFTGEDVTVIAVFEREAAESSETVSKQESSEASTVEPSDDDTLYLVLLGILIVALAAFGALYIKRR